jgi:methionyl-tRNA synthetase
MAKCDYGNDGEFSMNHFIETYNSDLANNLGNVVSRVVSMAIKVLLEGFVNTAVVRTEHGLEYTVACFAPRGIKFHLAGHH